MGVRACRQNHQRTLPEQFVPLHPCRLENISARMQRGHQP